MSFADSDAATAVRPLLSHRCMLTLRRRPRIRSEAEKSQGGKSYNCSKLRAGILVRGSQVRSLSERLMDYWTQCQGSLFPLYHFAAPKKSVMLPWSSSHAWTPRTSSAAVLPCTHPSLISHCQSPWIRGKSSPACFSLPEPETVVVLWCSDLGFHGALGCGSGTGRNF